MLTGLQLYLLTWIPCKVEISSVTGGTRDVHPKVAKKKKKTRTHTLAEVIMHGWVR